MVLEVLHGVVCGYLDILEETRETTRRAAPMNLFSVMKGASGWTLLSRGSRDPQERVFPGPGGTPTGTGKGGADSGQQAQPPGARLG